MTDDDLLIREAVDVDADAVTADDISWGAVLPLESAVGDGVALRREADSPAWKRRHSGARKSEVEATPATVESTPSVELEPTDDLSVVAVGDAPEDRLTEAGAAERFAREHGNDVRYIHGRGLWLLWRDHRWAPDTDAGVTRLALEFARRWQQEAILIPDQHRKGAAVKAALRLERREALDSMLRLARALKPIADAGVGWDSRPELLGVPNGVVELHTGRLRAGRRADQITMCTGAPYHPEAHSALWSQTLSDVFVHAAIVDFMHVAAGYSTTGDMRRDCWFLAHGSGRNGKGTIFHPIRRALGDYAMELPASVFDQRGNGTPFDLASLPARRFVMSSESGDTIRLHHDRIKQLSGGDPVRAAHKHERSFEFSPACKLWLACNRRPNVTDDSVAFWARVLTIPFTVSFVGCENRDLRPTLEHDPTIQAAILAWLIKGAVIYYSEGLHAPDAITDATRTYERESDPLADFIDTALVREAHGEITARDVFDLYVQWAKDQGLGDREVMSTTMFGRRMAERFKWRKVQGQKHYMGIARRLS